jgi:RNA polymerase sigma-70 factor (ECF subfamily)
MDVRDAFFELADEERLILAMHLFLGYTSKEIAAFLEMNENTVRSRESRALQKMGNRLKGV